jgi:2-keto-3-deoxy-6-phosphogluconate aldolase
MLMPFTKYAFIARAPGFSADKHRAEFASPQFVMTVVGVGTVEEAEAVAQALVKEGVQLIELCGAFEQSAAERVSAAVDKDVPVGVVTFRGEAMHRLEALIAQRADAGR